MRKVEKINIEWAFLKGDTKDGKPPRRIKGDWEVVNLPHTWNALDGQDGGYDFYRGPGWYYKEIKVRLAPDEEVYLEFPAASMMADVYINGSHACHHEGGFSVFRVNATPYIKHKKLKIAVRVDNSESTKIYPQTADFTFFGGLYRGVKLISVNKSHFELDYFGSRGVSVTPVLSDDLKSADVELEAWATNADDCTIKYQIAGKYAEGNKASIHINNPHLWNGTKDPYLYTLVATLERDGQIVDEVNLKFGIRSFKMDPAKGFFLNGESYPLHGVSRHQDRLNKGWAISTVDQIEDLDIISEMGANTIRLAHYQHSRTFYDLCDKYGMVVWAEIPFISTFMPGEEAKQNTLSQMKELVIQSYHHPSIVCWGISNEITIGGECPELYQNLRELNDLCHKLDKTRVTTMAQLSMTEMDSEMNHISDIVSYNHYFGWYMGKVEDNGPWLDEFHEKNPDIVLGVSEYGCEGILKYHNDDPKVQDYSEEYQAYYHENMLETFATRPYLWATHVWNMFDFASDMRDEGGVKGRNNKGLVTFDRTTKKDSYYIYKAYWSDEKFVYICGRRYKNRPTETTDIKVYSNCGEVTLFVNEKQVGTEKCDKKVTFKDVALKMGVNKIKAVADDYIDEIEINRVAEPDESYALKVEESGNSGSNWFETIEVTATELQFPEGYFSIHDKFGDIMKNPEGEELITGLMDMISTQMNMKISKGMLNMAKGMTIEKIFSLAGDRVPEKAKLWLNEELNKIKK